MIHLHRKQYQINEGNPPSPRARSPYPPEPTFTNTTNKSTFLIWLRRYFFVVGLIVLACARWKYDLFTQTPHRGGWNSFQTWVFAADFGAYLLAVVLLLSPWWRLGPMITGLGYAIVLPSCTYVVTGLLIVDLAYVHQQILFRILLLSGLLAQISYLFIPLGAESRQFQAAEACKLHLRAEYEDLSDKVEEFIVEIEGAGKNPDISQWSRFADSDGKNDRMLRRLDLEFVRWLDR